MNVPDTHGQALTSINLSTSFMLRSGGARGF